MPTFTRRRTLPQSEGTFPPSQRFTNGLSPFPRSHDIVGKPLLAETEISHLAKAFWECQLVSASIARIPEGLSTDLHPDTDMEIDERKPTELGAMGTAPWTCRGIVALAQYTGQRCPGDVVRESVRLCSVRHPGCVVGRR